MQKRTPALIGALILMSFFINACTARQQSAKGQEFVVLTSDYVQERIIPDTPFPGVNGATIASDGHLYVTHTGNGTVTRVDLKTLKPKLFVPASRGVFIPDDIAADDKGNLYVTGTTPLVGEVYRIGLDGTKSIIAEGMAAPNGVEYDKRTGRLFVTECFQGNRVYEVDPTGKTPARLLIDKDVIPVPEGFDFDPDTGDLIIPDMGTGKILRVNPDTGAMETLAEGFTTPIALDIGSDKMIYVPELATGAVYKLSLDGARREKIAQLVPGLDNLAITPAGRLFVTSYWNATIYEVATDGSGQYKQLFADGINQPLGLVVKKDRVFVADAIMIRAVANGAYTQTRLNAWAAHGMPLTLSLADGPGDQLFWTDCIHGAVAMGDPVKGEFNPVAGDLNRPMSVVMSPTAPILYVAEYGAGRITTVSLTDGAKAVLTEGLEGPLALTLVDGMLYVAESKVGRISAVDPKTGKKAVVVASLAAKPGAIAGDGQGNLLVLDGAGRQLFRLNPKTGEAVTLAVHLPVQYATIGSYPPVEFPLPMFVTKSGDIFIGTNDRGMIKLRKVK